MDFIVGLPLTARIHDSIFVVVDTLTKSAHFIPVRTTYQAPDIERVFISEIVRLHGVPKKIISRGLESTNPSTSEWHPWSTWCVLKGTSRDRSDRGEWHPWST
jgi:hypothetical protein